MSDNLTTRLDAIETLMSTQHTAVMGALGGIQDTLDLLNTAVDTLNSNGATNTKALLAAIGQTGPCFPCPTPPLTVPPISTDPTTIDTESCQRTQGMIATLHNLLGQMDTMQSFNIPGTWSVVNDAINGVIGAIVAGDTVPLPSFPEVVNIVGDYVGYAGERLFSGVGLVEQFAPLEASLRDATWEASDPATAAAAYNGVIDGSGASNGAKLLFKAIAYTALWSYYYDPASSPDVSGYDGTVCGVITSCEILHSAPTSINGGGLIEIVVWPIKWLPVDNHDGTTSSQLTWATRNLHNYIVTPTEQCKIFVSSGDSGNIIFGGATYTIPVDTTYVAFVRDGGSDAFDVEICPPAGE